MSALSGCTVTIINIKSKDLQVFCDSEHVKLSAVPRDLKSNTRTLSFLMQNITSLGDEDLQHVTDLRQLIIKSSRLKFINRLAFKGLSNLMLLNLRNNSLQLDGTSLPKDSFRFLTSLKILDLSQNPITFIPDLYFQYLGFTLTSLYLSDLSDKLSLSQHSLYGLKDLEYLDITFNNFQTIRKTMLGNIIDRSTFNTTTVLLAGNLWNCDCRLRWIREWYFDNLNRINVNLIEEIRPELRNTLRPFCHSPLKMRGVYLFPLRSSTLAVQEMKCTERSMTNGSTISAQENSNTTLSCTFIIDKMDSYTDRVAWLHNGEIITSKSHLKTVVKNNVDNFKLVSYLILVNIKTSYQGTWQCQLRSTQELNRIFTDFHLNIKADDNQKLSNRSKKLLIYISISLLTFLLIVFGIGLVFYLCFRCHKEHLRGNGKRKIYIRSGDKDIRPKSIEGAKNHILLYDDCDTDGRKMLTQYQPYSFSCDIQCGCKECRSINLDSLNCDSKSVSPCPVHGICSIPLKDIEPNIEPKKPCPIHGESTIDRHLSQISALQSISLPERKPKNPVTLDSLTNDIVLSTLAVNKRIHLNCPVHGEVVSLNRPH